MGDGATAANLPSPPTAFTDLAAVWDRSPAQLFHTTKFGRLEKLMPPWQNELSDGQIWEAVTYAWSLHTEQLEIEAGKSLYEASCASCHGAQGAGDGPQAEGNLPDFSDQQYAVFRSQADWSAGWQKAHPDIGGEWSVNDQSKTLEYVRTFSYWPPWESSYRPGNGTITGKVVQGTPGEAAPVNLPIVLEAYIGFQPIAAFTSTIGVDGSFRFADLATDPNISYLATVAANGISYSSDFLVLSPLSQTVESEVAVFATTNDPSSVRVNRSHWIIDQQPGAILGGAIYIFGNRGDRTFIGRTMEGVDRPVTVGVQVPPGAVDVALDGGAIGDRFFQVGDVIYDTLPLLPGENTRQLVVRYALPYEASSADLEQQFLYPVDQLSLLVTSLPGLQVDAPALEAVGPREMGGQEYLVFSQSGLEPQTVDVKVTGLLAAGSPDPRSSTTVGSENSAASADNAGGLPGSTAAPMESWASWVMMVLVAASLLGGVGFAIQRGSLNSQYSRSELADQREMLLQRMAHLDDLHATGEINQSDWMQQRSYLKAQLVHVVQRWESKT
jgi:mono/diheme cytochrome c family protein